jgi:hypothetical protein
MELVSVLAALQSLLQLLFELLTNITKRTCYLFTCYVINPGSASGCVSRYAD